MCLHHNTMHLVCAYTTARFRTPIPGVAFLYALNINVIPQKDSFNIPVNQMAMIINQSSSEDQGCLAVLFFRCIQPFLNIFKRGGVEMRISSENNTVPIVLDQVSAILEPARVTNSGFVESASKPFQSSTYSVFPDFLISIHYPLLMLDMDDFIYIYNISGRMSMLE